MFAATACLPPLPAPMGSGPSVIVYGDSVTENAERHDFRYSALHMLTDELVAAGYQAQVDTIIGAETEDLLDPMVRPTAPVDVIAVELGTNDLRYIAPEATAAQIETSISYIENIFAFSACDVSVTVPAEPTWGLDLAAPAFNARLRETADVVFEWADMVAANPSYVRDGIHLTDSGKVAFRAGLVAAVQQCPTSPEPPGA
jgi:lysophospholipase L1-like esterase